MDSRKSLSEVHSNIQNQSGKTPEYPGNDIYHYIDVAGLLFVIVNEKQKVSMVNNFTCNLLDYNSEEILGKNWFNYFNPGYRHDLKTAFKKILAGELNSLEHIEVPLVSRTGTERLIEWHIVPVLNNTAGGCTVLYTGTDITERKRKEEELYNSAAQFQAILNTTPDAILQVDRELKVIWANKIALDIDPNFINQYCYKAAFGREEPCEGCPLIKAIETEQTTKTPLCLNEMNLPKNINYLGTYWDGIGIPFRNRDGQVVGAISLSRNVTERMQAEIELMRHRDHLEELIKERTNRLNSAMDRLKKEIKDGKRMQRQLKELYENEQTLRSELEKQIERRKEFTRILIHELKTPLTPMMGASDMLIKTLEDETSLRIAHNIQNGAKNLNNRINDLVDLAKGEMGVLRLRFKRIDARLILNEIADYVSIESHRKGQSFTLKIFDNFPLFWADEDRIRQIILNLVNNAIKYTPNGGRIILKAEEKENDFVCSIIDNGPGIREETRQWLFEFYRPLKNSNSQFSGLGLGLPLSKMLVELHNGQIWLENNEKGGSTFKFSIPMMSDNED